MLLEPDVPDDEFGASFAEHDLGEVLEMRRMLATVIGTDPLKIRADWKFREEPHLKNMDMAIFHAFATRYAPARFGNHQAFAFPTAHVSTVRDFFVETLKLKHER